MYIDATCTDNFKLRFNKNWNPPELWQGLFQIFSVNPNCTDEHESAELFEASIDNLDCVSYDQTYSAFWTKVLVEFNDSANAG